MADVTSSRDFKLLTFPTGTWRVAWLGDVAFHYQTRLYTQPTISVTLESIGHATVKQSLVDTVVPVGELSGIPIDSIWADGRKVSPYDVAVTSIEEIKIDPASAVAVKAGAIGALLGSRERSASGVMHEIRGSCFVVIAGCFHCDQRGLAHLFLPFEWRSLGGFEEQPSHRPRSGIDRSLAESPSSPVDVNDGLGELCRCLLRQIVPYAAGNVAMLILADVLLGIEARVSMRCAVRVAFQGDRRTSDSWKCRNLLL
jgi:hypothetical protein